MKTTAIEKILSFMVDYVSTMKECDFKTNVSKARAELEAMKAERLAIATSIKCTVNGEAPDNLAECVSYLMLQEYYPAQNTIHQKYLEIKGLKAQLAAKDAALRDMYALACELGEDDGFYFEQRNGMERVANAAQALKESEQE